MKYLLLVLLIALTAQAGDYEYQPEEYGYKSSAGRTYEYDTNNAADSIRYNSDYNAQFRDELDTYTPDHSKNIIEDAYGDRGRGAGILDD